MNLMGVFVSVIFIAAFAFPGLSQPAAQERRLAALTAAPNPPKIIVPLRIDPSASSFRIEQLFCEKDFKYCGLLPGEKEKVSTFGVDGRQVWIGRAGSDFLVSVDTNGVRGVADEKKVRLPGGSAMILKVRIQVAPGRYGYFPFQISHKRDEEDGTAIDSFLIKPHYAAVGTVRLRDCYAKLLLHDLNADGRFEPVDAKGGSNLGLDLNNDGKIAGRAEFHNTNEIIEFCGGSYLVSDISNARIVFEPTELKIAKIGKVVPDFSVTLLDTTVVTAETLKGRAYVLDFWASWCVPCVENLPEIVKLKEEARGSFGVYSINVDEAEKRSSAREIIEKYRLGEFSAIRGLGSADPVWKIFGGANFNQLAIPLYVLIDRDGIVRYADNGGKGLAELREAISGLETR